MTTEEFKAKAINKHGDRYDYSKSVYTRSTDKVIIVCKVHGEFLQTPHKHNLGCGCPKCGVELIRKKATGSLQNFLDRAVKKHGNKYDYSKVTYTSAKTKVKIICPIHGEFEQTPDDHTRGSGCSMCSRSRTAKRMTGSRRVSVETFVDRATKVHGDKYDYSKVTFTVTNEKVLITCPIHGDFKQVVTKHLLGSECPQCSLLSQSRNTWSYSKWETIGKKSPNFDGFKVYCVRCSNSNETFYKIGKTYRKVEERMTSIRNKGYNTEIIEIWKGDAYSMSNKERELHRINNNNKYYPKISFCGRNECFSEVKYGC